MKKILLLVFLLFSAKAFSQDYMDKIVDQSCECLDKISDTLKGESLKMELGLCIINAAQPYKKQLKKDYGIDFVNIDKQGEKLGNIIGLKMAGVCPNALIAMSEKINAKENGSNGNTEQTFEGEVIKIDKENFIVFTVKDDAGKALKFLWLGFVEAEGNFISDYNSLTGKNIKITYTSEELFDPKLNEYRQFNIIKKIK